MAKQHLHIKLAAPRGFCAGVERAIQMVEKALEKYGAPVYVRHQIVHNKHVVQDLESKGAVFVKELTDIPGGTTQPVLFSAHGVSKAVVEQAGNLNLFSIDATCPLVTKVHREVDLHHRMNRKILMIGHKDHPEVLGTTGQLPAGEVILIETVEDAETLDIPDAENLTFVTQTTLSVDETADIIAALKKRFPAIVEPKREDICYATTNRQAAVREIASKVDLFLIVGGKNSSNSNRLVETALRYGAPQAFLVEAAEDIDWDWFAGVGALGLSSGASVPENLVTGVLEACQQRFQASIEAVTTAVEDAVFNLPRILAS